MVVVDTNIAAYLLIEGVRNEEARALLKRDSEWHTEAFLFTELTNVLVTFLRSKSLTMPQCLEILDRAEETFGMNTHHIPHAIVLSTANEFRITAYDARFIALAKMLGRPLITEDVKLRNAAPKLTQSLNEALA